MNCPRCATINLDGSAVCSSCGAQLPATTGAAAAVPYGAPPGPPPGYPPPGYPPTGYPPPGYPPGAPPPQGYYPPGAPQGYYPPPYGVPMQVAPSYSGMAIAGFVLSFLGCLAVLGLIFSIIGYNETKNSNGMKTGGGLALAGIIISIAVLSLLFIASTTGANH